MIYKFKSGYPTRAMDAQKVGDRLERIRKRKGLTPAAVVEDARPMSSPLHPAFEWDDTIAAAEFRMEQARALIRAVVDVGESPSDTPVRAFWSEPGEGGNQYESIQVILASPERRAAIVEKAFHELESWQRRYSHLQELADVFSAIEAGKASLG